MSWFRRLLLSIAFLTRVPIPVGSAPAADLAASIAFFPLVGFALGAVLVGAAQVLPAALEPGLVGALLVTLLAAITGGLHLDGLADVFDALGGGRGSRERMLEILRDPRIGAHGAAALVLVLLVKSLAVGALVAEARWGALIAFPAVARFAIVPLLVLFPAARSEGLGKSFRELAGAREVAIAGLVTAVGLLALPAWPWCALLASLGVALALGAWLSARLGGLNGDAYGAALELAEIAFLVTALAGGA